MKIYDIIAEKKTDEGIVGKTIAKVLEPTLTKAANWATSKLGAKAAQAAAKSQGNLPKAATNLWTHGGAKFASPAIASAKLINNFARVLKYYGLYQMASEYNSAMKRGDEMLKSGKWSQEDYDDYHKNQMGVLISQIVIAGPLWMALKVSSGWSLMTIGLKASRQPIAVAVGTSLTALTTGAQALLIQGLNTKESRYAIADMIANTFIDDTLGDAGVKALQKVKEMVGIAEKKADSGEATPDADSNNTDKKDTTTDTKPKPKDEPKSAPFSGDSDYRRVIGFDPAKQS